VSAGAAPNRVGRRGRARPGDEPLAPPEPLAEPDTLAPPAPPVVVVAPLSEKHAERAEQVARELARLEALNARGFDLELCDCVRALLERAVALGGGAGDRLVVRAEGYLSELQGSFERSRARAEALVTELEASRGPQPELRARMTRGELTDAVREARHLRARPQVARPKPVQPAPAARTASDLARQPQAPTTKQVAPRRSAQKLAYEDSVAELVASFAMARAVDVVPEDAGPYNPLRIASDLLDSLRGVSPMFLTVQLNRLEELGSMLTLPELPEKAPPEPPPSAKKKLPSSPGGKGGKPKK
jgi:Protein of unknown function (DUF2894)